MKLEDQVVNLDLSKRLKELNVKQISIFKWIKANHPTAPICDAAVQHSGALEDSYDETPVSDGWTLTSWAAFTVAELGEMLPENIHIFMLKVKDLVPTWFCTAGECNGEATNWEETSDILQSNAIAKMLIHLIENKLMEVPK